MTSLARDVWEGTRELMSALAQAFSGLCRVMGEIGEHADRLVANLHAPDPVTGDCEWCHRSWPCRDQLAASRRLATVRSRL